MIKPYEKFIGKVCTILIEPAKFPFTLDKIQHAEFFTGLVVEVHAEGILIKNLNSNAYAFYMFPIIGIVEEQSVSKSHPDYEKIKTELEQKKKPIQKPAPSPQIALTIEELTRQASQINTRRSSSNS
jgi:hypothetical protein